MVTTSSNNLGANTGVPIIFIHGFKGSILADKLGRVRWITLVQALNPLPHSNIALPLTYTNGKQDSDGLQPIGPIEQLGSSRFGAQLYGPFLRYAATLGRPFYTFSYDWRRCNLETAEAFEKFLEKIKSEWKCAPQVIAHSMGGMITCFVVNRCPELFHSIVFAGVPFQLTCGYIKDVNFGNFAGFNQHMVTPEVLFSFSSIYTLFPLDGQGMETADGQTIILDYFKSETWIENKLGIFNDISAVSNFGPDHIAHLKTVLPRAKKFREGLEPIANHPYPPIAVLAGIGHSCLLYVVKDGPKAVRGYDFDTKLKEDGDNRVTADRAVPPVGIPYKIFTTKQSHTTLLNDEPLVRKIINELLDDRIEQDNSSSPAKPVRDRHPMPRHASMIMPHGNEPMEIL